MYSKNDFKGKKCIILGLGVSNRPLVDFLLSCGATVEARDKKTYNELLPYSEDLKEKGVSFLGGDNYLLNLDCDYIFRSPGIRPDCGDIPSCIKRGAILLSETELFVDLCPCPIIGITGSDGKTTTSTLTALLLERSGRKVWLGGNIGTPLLPLLDEIKKDDVAVMELSSFQLMTFKNSVRSAAVTNISENHLNWHTDMAEYISAKSNIFSKSGNRLLVLNAADEQTEHYISLSKGEIRTFSSKSDADICLCDGYITVYGKKMLKVSDILIPGMHNVENYMTAIALTLDYKISADDIYSVASTFKGVKHRIEFIRLAGGVSYYNSSIDSTPTRTAATLKAIGRKAIVICGGQDKHLSFTPLSAALGNYASAVVLTGEAMEEIHSSLIENHINIPIVCEKDFTDAIHKAISMAKPGDTVVLSPACTSFDAFANFEERGDKFREIIEAL